MVAVAHSAGAAGGEMRQINTHTLRISLDGLCGLFRRCDCGEDRDFLPELAMFNSLDTVTIHILLDMLDTGYFLLFNFIFYST